MHLPRLLVVGEPVGDESAQLFFCFFTGHESVAQRNERHWNFARRGVGTSNDPTLPHRRMLQQYRFHLRWRYGKSLVLNHLLAAIDDTVETFTIARDNVA